MNVQFLLVVPPEAHPPRTDPPVNIGGQIWDFNDGAPQISDGGCLAVCGPVALKTTCVAGARGIDMHDVVSVLLSEMIRPNNAPKTSTKPAISSAPTRKVTATRCTRRQYTAPPQISTHIPVPFHTAIFAGCSLLLLKMGTICEYARVLAESFY